MVRTLIQAFVLVLSVQSLFAEPAFQMRSSLSRNSYGRMDAGYRQEDESGDFAWTASVRILGDEQNRSVRPGRSVLRLGNANQSHVKAGYEDYKADPLGLAYRAWSPVVWIQSRENFFTLEAFHLAVEKNLNGEQQGTLSGASVRSQKESFGVQAGAMRWLRSGQSARAGYSYSTAFAGSSLVYRFTEDRPAFADEDLSWSYLYLFFKSDFLTADAAYYGLSGQRRSVLEISDIVTSSESVASFARRDMEKIRSVNAHLMYASFRLIHNRHSAASAWLYASGDSNTTDRKDSGYEALRSSAGMEAFGGRGSLFFAQFSPPVCGLRGFIHLFSADFTNQILQSMTVRVGTHDPGSQLGAVEVSGCNIQSYTEEQYVHTCKVEQFLNCRGFQQAFEIGGTGRLIDTN